MSTKTLTNLNQEKYGIIVSDCLPSQTNSYSLGTTTKHWKEIWTSQHSFLPNGKSVLRVSSFGSSPPVTKAANGGYEFYLKSTVDPKKMYYYPNDSTGPMLFNEYNGLLVYLINPSNQLFIYLDKVWYAAAAFS